MTGRRPEDLISDFRNSYHPRIAVTVDMIATGTDIRPLEILLFMRAVKSRLLFEQMLGRGTRVVSPTELQNVTSDALVKDRFVLIDAVGIMDQELTDPQTLERKRSVSFKQLLESVAVDVTDADALSSLAGRLASLAKRLGTAEQAEVKERSGGLTLSDLANRLLDALDPDKSAEVARDLFNEREPSPEQVAQAEATLMEAALKPLASNPELRSRLVEIQTRHEQAIDEVSQDQVLEAGFSVDGTERARSLVRSFEEFIAEHKDEITALQIIYSFPRKGGQSSALAFAELKQLSEALSQPPRSWTTEALWRAYSQLERDRVRGAGTRRVLTDLVSLVRHAVHLEDELVPYPERVQRRYQEWLSAQESEGHAFTPEQRWWLDQIATHIGVNLQIRAEGFNYGEFFNRGGQIAALRAFGPQFRGLLDQLNEKLNQGSWLE